VAASKKGERCVNLERKRKTKREREYD